MVDLNINMISLITLIQDYFDGYTENSFEQQGKNIFSTKCPIHKEKRGNSFAIYNKEGIWDWCCFGACGTGGNAAKLLTLAFPEKFPTPEKAAADIRERYGLTLPDTVTLDAFANFKGFDVDFLREQGITEVDGGILIPFYGVSGETLAVKKRMKFEGKPKYLFTEGKNTIYGLEAVAGYDSAYVLVLEGETDTLTARYCGLQAVGIPGANSWQPEWATYLQKFDKIIAVPDRDKAGSNLLDKLKADLGKKLHVITLPKRAKDVSEQYIYLCNTEKTTLQAYFNIANAVPATIEGFMETLNSNPTLIKNDLAMDLMVSNLKDPISQAIFIDDVQKATKIGKKIVGMAVSLASERVHKDEAAASDDDIAPVFVEDNCYCKWRFIDGEPEKMQITNFVVKLHHTMNRDGEYLRVCTLVGQNGKVSKPIILDGESLSNPQKFNTECISRGDYMFDGTGKDLNHIRRLILGQDNPVVIQPNYIGHIEDKWIMGDIGIDSKGNVVEVDEYGILNLDGDNYACPAKISSPQYHDFIPATTDFRRQVADTILKNIGGFEAWMGLGWAVAGWHSDNIFKHGMENSFPLLFIHGKRNSGKTWLAKWLMKQFGLGKDNGDENGLGSGTLAAMSNKLANYASLPVWWDDYRNTIRDITARGDRLLLAYNRSGRERAHRTDGVNETFPIRAFVMLTGEDTPTSELNALQTRCVFLQVSEYMRNDEYTAEMLELVTQFHRLGLHFLIDHQRNGSTALLKEVDRLTDKLMANGVDSRIARCHAILAAGFTYGYGDVADPKKLAEFEQWLIEFAKQEKVAREDDHVVRRFLQDITTLMENGDLTKDTHYVISGNVLHLHSTQVYEIWRKHVLDLRGSVVEWRVLLDYLKKEPWSNIGVLKRYAGLGGKPVKGIGLDLNTVPCEELVTQCYEVKDEF